MPERIPARDLDAGALDALVLEEGGRPFHARELHLWLHARGLLDWNRATNLPKALRDRLSETLELRTLRLLEEEEARDGTLKFLLGLGDGEAIEAVLIPRGTRSTLCMSTQVGCPVGCIFCASGLEGVRRNLSRAEILEQFWIARERLGRPPDNIVVMGIGEPMANLRNLTEALDLLVSPKGAAYSARRITISTSGHPERIRRLASLGKPYELAVSLHAADPDLRRELVPTAKHDPEELVRAAAFHGRATGREPTFEIVLLADRNDRREDAEALCSLLRGLPCTVNLIPWNPVEVPGGDLRSPGDRRVERFRGWLERGGLKTTLRRHRGRDRDAACGQLRLRRPPAIRKK